MPSCRHWTTLVICDRFKSPDPELQCSAGTVKLTMPMAFTTTMLAWSLLAFPESFTSGANQTSLIGAKNGIRWGADYLSKTFHPIPNVTGALQIVYQVAF